MSLLSGPRPRLLGAVVQILDGGDPRVSDATLLIAALLTLGVPPATDEFFHITREAGRGEQVWQVIWTLRDISRDGRFATPKMLAAWDDGAWLLQNAQHPLAILRGGLTYQRAMAHTPRFTLAELARIETPDTWLEAACRNLVCLLRDMPVAAQAARKVIRFGRNHAAFVPQCMPDKSQTRFLNYVERPAKRAELRAA